MPPDFYPSNITFREREKKNITPIAKLQAGVHYRYTQNCVNEYSKKCKEFWANIRRRYDDAASDAERVALDIEEEALNKKMTAV